MRRPISGGSPAVTQLLRRRRVAYRTDAHGLRCAHKTAHDFIVQRLLRDAPFRKKTPCPRQYFRHIRGDCPAFIVVAEQPYNRSAAVGAKLKDQDYRAADIGLAVSQLVYRAHELGLSTCILGWFDEKTLQALLNTNARVRLIIAIGYARADDALRTKKRKSLEELVTWL